MSLINQLKNRRSEGISLNSMIVLSCLLHALALSIILFSPSVPSPKWTFGPAYTVDLVTAPVNIQEPGSAKTIPWDAVRMDSRDTTIVMKKSVETVRAIPIKPIRVRKSTVTKNIDEALEKIKKKVAATPKTRTKAAPAAPAAGASTAPAAGGAGARTEADTNTKMQVYYSILWAKIKEKWALPEGILASDNLEAIIAATILKDGSLGGLEFEKRSGNRFFDESAEKAVKKAAPFPALPEWLNEKSIDLGIRFRSSDLLG